MHCPICSTATFAPAGRASVINCFACASVRPNFSISFARNAASSAGLRGRSSQRDDVLSWPVSTSSIALCVTEMSVEPSAARSTCVRNMSRVPDEYAKSISLPMLFLNQSSGMFARFSAQSVVMMPVCGASVFNVKPLSCQNSCSCGQIWSGVRPSTTSQRRSPSISTCMPYGSCALGTPSVALPAGVSARSVPPPSELTFGGAA